MLRKKKPQIDVSIIIPTYHEERLLPHLLKSISLQTVIPKQIIVADNFSEDRTRQIALNYSNVIIVDGSDFPGIGRNNGAKKATGEILLFLDADGLLTELDFLEKMYFEFKERQLDGATSLLKFHSYDPINLPANFFCYIWNFLIRLTNQKYLNRWAISAGPLYITKKKIFFAVGCFNEQPNTLGEDHELTRRTIAHGYKVNYLRSIQIATSTRRINSWYKILRTILSIFISIILIMTGGKGSHFMMSLYGPLGGKIVNQKNKSNKIKKVNSFKKFKSINQTV